MKEAEIRLSYYKQGDDLKTCLITSGDNNDVINIPATMDRQIALLQSSILQLNEVKSIYMKLKPKNVKLDGDGHFIGISGPDYFINQLIKEEATKRNVKINAVCADLEDYEIEEDYDIILILGVLQFLGEIGENYIEKIQKHTKKDGINIIDAFRNKWLPKNKLEELYSKWKLLEKEEYVWERDNFARVIYLVVRK